MNCAIKQGFFLIRSCDQPAVTICPSCQRPACSAHFSPQNVCVECAARQNLHGAAQSEPNDPYMLRLDYYRKSNFQPLNLDAPTAFTNQAFDATDHAAFSGEHTPPDSWEEDSGSNDWMQS